jgi:hypothetical protein
MEAADFFQTLVSIYKTTRRRIPEDGNLHLISFHLVFWYRMFGVPFIHTNQEVSLIDIYSPKTI